MSCQRIFVLATKHSRISDSSTTRSCEFIDGYCNSYSLHKDHKELLELLDYLDLDCFHARNVIVAGTKHHNILPLRQISCWRKCK
jgi:hypothetical protein